VHCVEQQLALLGWTGVPVTDRPRTQLAVNAGALETVWQKLESAGFEGFDDGREFAVIHPSAAFDTKRWDIGKFAQVADELFDRQLTAIFIVTEDEAGLLESARGKSSRPLMGLKNLSLPEVTALTSRARVFIGNDSGIAHMAAAAGTPCVVIFGSSNVAHWRPWTTVPSEIVREELPCQPCPGYFCAEFEQPECILRVPVERVVAAIDRVLRATAN
jgi:heptosyltransferase III